MRLLAQVIEHHHIWCRIGDLMGRLTHDYPCMLYICWLHWTLIFIGVTTNGAMQDFSIGLLRSLSHWLKGYIRRLPLLRLLLTLLTIMLDTRRGSVITQVLGQLTRILRVA